MKKFTNKGFTIIELLIATVVFSVILLVVTGAIVQFSRIYYKGVIQARTQERARAIIDDISQNLQFAAGSSPVTGDPTLTPNGYFCVGNRLYTYVKDVSVASDQRALVAQSGVSCSSANAFSPMTAEIPSGSTATELVGEKMQLLNLSVKQVGDTDLYAITVKLAYGEPGDRQGGVCKAVRLGGQFCAISELSTTVSQRLK